MLTGVESLAPLQGFTTVEPSSPSENLVDVGELGQEFEQSVFGETVNPNAAHDAAADAQGPSVADTIGNRLIDVMEGLNTELESTMEEVVRLISKKPSEAELLQLQLKATQLFITHELSSKIVSKATNSLDQLVHSQ